MTRSKPAIVSLSTFASVDLRSITRDVDRVITTVELTDLLELNRVPWLTLGSASLRRLDRGGWQFQAHMRDGVTDIEHDSALAVRFPLVGVRLDSVYDGVLRATGYIPAGSNDFHVPRPGYNPIDNPPDGANWCKCEPHRPPHLMLPEGFYVPPEDQETYRLVCGMRVQITMGPQMEEET